MSATDQLSRITPYARRLMQDEYIQDQISQAIGDLRRSSRRIKGKSAKKAINDRRLRGQLRDAAGSVTQVACALRQPPQPPKRRKVKRGLVLATALGGGAFAWQRLSTDQIDHAGGTHG